MYSIGQFRAALYSVLLLSVLGYGIALDSPLHMLIGTIVILAHLWITHGGRSVLAPRWLTTSIAIVSAIWSVAGLISGVMQPLLAVSQWLFILMLAILWSRHDNRSFAQMLVMSLVLMVAGSVNTASLFYGIVLLVYLAASLYCSLLFHLKVETDGAVAAYQLPREKLALQLANGDRAAFGRSMRRLTILVSGVAGFVAVLVFILFPRAAAPSMMMRLQPASAAPLTGFSERVSLGQVAKITQNEGIIAHVSVSENGKPWTGQELYLRGMALDVYTGHAPSRSGLSWQWIRSDDVWATGRIMNAIAGTQTNFAEPQPRQIRQHILLKPTGTQTLFALGGAYGITTDRDVDVSYYSGDASLRLNNSPSLQLQYEVVSSGEVPEAPATDPASEIRFRPREFGMAPFINHSPSVSQIDPKVAAYARKPEVSGSNDKGPLVEQRPKSAAPTALDERIAKNIEQHLQHEFKYTLDLTDTTRKRDEDPIAAFLYDYRRGHCEYFAGAMALMCQSLGMKARMVIGFRVGPEDYNHLGQYYLVRQSQAHAWVEVLTPGGWKTFDPTSGDEFYQVRKTGGLFRGISDFFDYLQYKWSTGVVTYSNETRSAIWQRVEGAAKAVTGFGTRTAQSIRDYFHSDAIYRLTSRLIAGAIILSLLLLAIAVGFYVAEKRRLFRRAQRIGLSNLPTQQQLHLARQLAFYDDLLLLLERQQIQRPLELTAREFASSLSFLPPGPYEEIGHVTDVYYRVRYGQESLTPGMRRRLAATIGHISGVLTSMKS